MVARPAPYIGICDFDTSAQILNMAELMTANAKPMSRRLLMAGIMISRETMHGIPSK
ncbi:MAG: hypothetical protein V1738_01895 [Patescibacteria group bacterium]